MVSLVIIAHKQVTIIKSAFEDKMYKRFGEIINAMLSVEWTFNHLHVMYHTLNNDKLITSE